MIRSLMGKQSAKFRIAVGQVSILVSVLLVAAFVGLVPERTSAVLEGRTAVAEAVAANSSVFITRSDLRRVEANLEIVVARNDEVLSAALRRKDGEAVVTVGEHENYWQPIKRGMSTTTQLQVPILERDQQWGTIELRFKPVLRSGLIGFFFDPLFHLVMFVSLLSFVCFYFYLGRMLKHLDPSQAIPDRVRSALDTMAEGLLVLDARQNIVLANSAFSSLVGRSPAALMGGRIADFSWQLDDDRPLDSENAPWNTVIRDAEPQMGVILRLRLANDERHSFMVNCSPVLGSEGKAMGVLVSFDDITELEEKEVALRQSMELAEQANRAKSDFLANMSHEIRTPMNAILGFTEVLKRGYQKSPEASAKYLDTISSSGNHLLNLINDILDLSKVEAGRLEVEQASCAVHEIVKDVLRIMAVKASEKNISLEYCPAGPLPETVTSDPARLRQVLTNLVGNAIKFTETGGVQVVTRLNEAGDESSITIDVIDSGIGMTTAQAEAVFNPFVQADTSITRRFGGTGLGLTISKRFVEAMGGDIKVSSEAGKGSTFSIVLPLGAVAGVPQLQPQELLFDEPASAGEETMRWLFPAAKVLVVDDGAENRELLQVVLGDLGLQIDVAENGKIGADMVFANNYDLVLMDVNMPVMGGFEAVGLIRSKGESLPIIALTANAMKGVADDCLDAGYTGYMAKPINLDELTSMLATELGGKQVQASEVTNTDTATSVEPATEMTANPAATAVTEEPADEGPIVSSLPMSNEKLRTIAEKFIVRLGEQLAEFEAACTAQDGPRVADLAHWLKGSAGSVGFHQITTLAAEMEQCALNNQLEAASAHVADLRSKYPRITVTGEVQALTPASDDNGAGNYDLPDVLQSKLPGHHKKFQLIIQKFANRLAEQLVDLETAINTGDYATILDLAAWLKGSAGSVGFDAFTPPAEEMEHFAQQQQLEPLRERFEYVRELSRRIDISDLPPETDIEPVKRAESGE